MREPAKPGPGNPNTLEPPRTSGAAKHPTSCSDSLTDTLTASLGASCARPSGDPLDRVILVPAREPVLADGLALVRFSAISVDRPDSPVADIELSRVRGDGALPAEVKTDRSGVGSVYYTVSAASGPEVVRAVYNIDLEASAVGLRGPKPFPVPILRPVPLKAGALVKEWSLSFAELRVE